MENKYVSFEVYREQARRAADAVGGALDGRKVLLL